MDRQQVQRSRLGAVSKALGWLVSKLPLIALVAIIISPVGPHMRWQYRYVDGYSDRVYTHCIYIGARGQVVADHLTPYCPFFVILDSRAWPKP